MPMMDAVPDFDDMLTLMERHRVRYLFKASITK